MRLYLSYTSVLPTHHFDNPVTQISTEERNSHRSGNLTGKDVTKGIERPEERWLNQESCEESRHEYIYSQGRGVASHGSDQDTQGKPFGTHINVSQTMLGNQII
jgi:hypothetical protein